MRNPAYFDGEYICNACKESNHKFCSENYPRISGICHCPCSLKINLKEEEKVKDAA